MFRWISRSGLCWVIGCCCLLLVACQSGSAATASPSATPPYTKATPPGTIPPTVALTPILPDTPSLHLIAPVVPTGLDLTESQLSVSPDQSLVVLYDLVQIQIWRLTPPIQLVKTILFPATAPRGTQSVLWLPDSSGFVFNHGNEDIFATRSGMQTVLSQQGGLIYPSPASDALAFEMNGTTPNAVAISIDHVAQGVVQPSATLALSGDIILLGWNSDKVVVYATRQQIFGYNGATEATTAYGTISDTDTVYGLGAYGLESGSPDATLFAFITAKSGALDVITPHGIQLVTIQVGGISWYGAHELFYTTFVGNTKHLFQVDPATMRTQTFAAFPDTDFLAGSGPWLAYTPPGTTATLAAFNAQTNQAITISTDVTGNGWQLAATGGNHFYLLYNGRLYLIAPA